MSNSTRDFILEIIDNYKSHPCLWSVGHVDYNKRAKRDEALNELLQLFMSKDPKANLDTVRKKIATLRSCFKKENNKVKRSLRSGAEVHIPKLWYYNKMLFLADDDVLQASQSMEHNILDDIPFEQKLEASDCESEDNVSFNMYSPHSQNSMDPLTTIDSRKTKLKDESDNVLAKIAKKLEEPPRTQQEYDKFGEHIAERLRSLPNNMAIYCRKVINDAIFMAETNNLSIHSYIVNKRQITKVQRGHTTEVFVPRKGSIHRRKIKPKP